MKLWCVLLLGAAGIAVAAAGLTDQGMTGWSRGTWLRPAGEATVENGVATLVNRDADQKTLIYHALAVEPDTAYTLTAEMACRLATPTATATPRGGAGLQITINEHPVAGGSPNGSFRVLTGDSDWKRFSLSFRTPATDLKKCNLLLTLFHCQGSASFRNLELVKTPAPVTAPATAPGDNLAINGNFAAGLSGWGEGTWLKARGTVTVADGAVTLHNTDAQQRTLIFRGLRVQPGREYILSCQMKSALPESAAPGAGMRVDVTVNGKTVGGGSPVGAFRSLSGRCDWKNYTLKFKVPNDEIKSCNLFLVLYDAVGSAAYRDVRVVENVPPAAANAAKLQIVPAVWDNHVLHIAKGLPFPLLLDLRMPRPENGLVYELELPRGIRAIDGRHWHTAGGFAADLMTVGKSARGDGFTVYRFTPGAGYRNLLAADRLRWQNYYRIYIEAEQTAENQQGFLRATDRDGKTLGAEVPLTIHVLPMPVVKQKLEKFGFAITYVDALHAPSARVRRAYIDLWKSVTPRLLAGINFRFDDFPAEVRKEFFDHFDPLVFFGCTPTGILVSQLPDSLPKLIDNNGKPRANAACPREAMNPDSPLWTEVTVANMRAKLAGLPGNTPLQFDYEPGALDFCFCLGCRQEFSASVKAPKPLSAAEIRAQYQAQWLRYRIRQSAKIADNFAVTAKKYFPGHPVWFCTDPLHVDRPEGFSDWCGLDPRLNDNGNYDLFMNMFYHEGVFFYDNIALNVEKIKTPTFPLLDPTERMEMYYRRYTPEGVAMNLLAAAALGCPGAGFWPYDDFDARYLGAIVDAVNRIAPMENFYCSGVNVSDQVKMKILNVVEMKFTDGDREKTVRLPDLAASLRYRLHRHGDDFLLTVFNYDRINPILAEAAIAEPAVKNLSVHAVESNRKLEHATGERFRFAVEPGSVALFLLTPQPRPTAGVLPETELNRRLAAAMRQARELHKFESVRDNANFAGWGILNDLNKPLVKLSNGTSSVYLDPSDNGCIRGLLPDSAEDLLAQKKNRGRFDEPFIYGNTLPLNFQVESLTVAAGTPTVTMSATVPLPDTAEPDPQSPAGLKITKTVRLEKSRVVSEYTLKNPTSRPITAGARIRQWPRLLSATYENGNSRASDWTVELDANPTPVSIGKLGASDCVVLTAGTPAPPAKLTGTVVPSRWSATPVRLAATHGNQRVALNIALEPAAAAAAVLCWWSPSQPSTIEPLTREKTLKSGEVFAFRSILDWKN